MTVVTWERGGVLTITRGAVLDAVEFVHFDAGTWPTSLDDAVRVSKVLFVGFTGKVDVVITLGGADAVAWRGFRIDGLNPEHTLWVGCDVPQLTVDGVSLPGSLHGDLTTVGWSNGTIRGDVAVCSFGPAEEGGETADVYEWYHYNGCLPDCRVVPPEDTGSQTDSP